MKIKSKHLTKMKTIIKPIFLAFIAIAMLTNCGKEEICDACLFTYPDSGFYGNNILNLHDTTFKADINTDGLGLGRYCSMRATLPKATSKLKVIIEGKRVAIYNNQGWFTNHSAHRYDNYVFQAEGQLIADLKIHFDNTGKATIEIYEDDFNTYARKKVIYLRR